MGKREHPSDEKKSNKRNKRNKRDGKKVNGKEVNGKKAVETTDSLVSPSKPVPNSLTISRTMTLSNVFLKKIDVVVSLYPVSLRNCEESVENQISQLLLKYSNGLGGILMAFENVELKEDDNSEAKGWILNELPFIHYKASCDALVFRPCVGCKLAGVVNESFPSHLGILVFNYFNAMVSADQLRSAGYNFDDDLQKWTTEDGAQTISIQDKINFTAEKIHECAGTISLEGADPSLSLLVEN